jgi:hypothetical protein
MKSDEPKSKAQVFIGVHRAFIWLALVFGLKQFGCSRVIGGGVEK